MSSDERGELAQLRREKRRLEVENEILRRGLLRAGERPRKMTYPVSMSSPPKAWPS